MSVAVIANGSTSVSPLATTLYTLTAIGAGGTVTCTKTITVTEPNPEPQHLRVMHSPQAQHHVLGLGM